MLTNLCIDCWASRWRHATVDPIGHKMESTQRLEFLVQSRKGRRWNRVIRSTGPVPNKFAFLWGSSILIVRRDGDGM
jgi:hypothetical protein